MTEKGERSKILIDCDPGHDDAMALVVAAGDTRAELLGITTVAGNHTVERMTHNACVVATVAGINAPIVQGAHRPLIRTLSPAVAYHGESGLDSRTSVRPTVMAKPGAAPSFIAEQVLGARGQVTLIATGPLTNIALAIRTYPDLVEATRRVVVMGGSYTRGNITPAAEFNIYTDPEAAKIVFEAEWDLTMIGLDVTHDAAYSAERDARITGLGGPVREWLRDVMAYFADAYERAEGRRSPPVHDVCAVVAALHPEVFNLASANVFVETEGRYTGGMTVVRFGTGPEYRHGVAVGFDEDQFWTIVAEGVDNIAAC